MLFRALLPLPHYFFPVAFQFPTFTNVLDGYVLQVLPSAKCVTEMIYFGLIINTIEFVATFFYVLSVTEIGHALLYIRRSLSSRGAVVERLRD